MARARSDAASSKYTVALEAFRPDRYGFRRHRDGWVKDVSGLGTVAVAALSWPHAQAAAYDCLDGERVPTDALRLLVGLQQRVWGLPPEDLVPANILAILADTGGSVLVAYNLHTGFNADGWLGFVIGLGSRSGTLVSHMLGVREELRGTNDLGWHLKLIQGYEALRSGHMAATWTFDPMRGMNARLNIEKLGAVASEFTLDKYGLLPSALYGNVPSDRLTVRWDLLDPATAARLTHVYEGRYRGRNLADVAAIPEVTAQSAGELAAARPERLRYRIPGDIDQLMRSDPQVAIRWRQELRAVFTALLPTKAARVEEGAPDGPLAVGAEARMGEYIINGFATGLNASGERLSYYVFERRRAMRGTSRMSA